MLQLPIGGKTCCSVSSHLLNLVSLVQQFMVFATEMENDRAREREYSVTGRNVTAYSDAHQRIMCIVRSPRIGRLAPDERRGGAS